MDDVAAADGTSGTVTAAGRHHRISAPIAGTGPTCSMPGRRATRGSRRDRGGTVHTRTPGTIRTRGTRSCTSWGPPRALDPAASVYSVVANGFDAVDEVLRDPAVPEGARPGGQAPPPGARHAVPLDDVQPRTGPRPDARSVQQDLHPAPARRAGRRPAGRHRRPARPDGRAAARAARRSTSSPSSATCSPPRSSGCCSTCPSSDLAWFRERAHRIDAYLDLGGKADEKLRAADDAVHELTDVLPRPDRERRRTPGRRTS